MPRQRKTQELEPPASSEGPKAGDNLDINADTLRKVKGQGRVATGGAEVARRNYQERAAEHAEKAHVWKRAQQTKEAREADLVKVHANKPFDDESAGRVAKEAARALEAEKFAMSDKQEAKKALDEAWEAWSSIRGDEPVQRLIPDDEEEGADG